MGTLNKIRDRNLHNHTNTIIISCVLSKNVAFGNPPESYLTVWQIIIL